MNPYLVLNVPVDANDARIRRAYLEAIKQATPDKDPKRFQAFTEAYNKIKDESSRLRHALFNRNTGGDSPVDVLVRYAQTQNQSQPLPFEAMKEFLRACSKT
jgi:curved DNA-binding protein CbpA